MPAREQAIREINTLVSRGRPGDRLPSVAVLARQSAVSYVTMWRAVQEFGNAGILTTRKGAPTSILTVRTISVPKEEPVCVQTTGRLKWMQVLDRINSIIVEGGSSADGALPGIKEFASRCGASVSTVHKAMRIMERDGWVTVEKRRYRMKRAALLPGPATLVLFTRVLREGTLLTEKANDGLRMLQEECARRGIRIRTMQYVHSGDAPTPLGGARYPRFSADELRSILGFMVWTIGLDGLDLDRLVRSLDQTGRPVVVLDESGEYLERPARPILPRVREFCLSYPKTAGFEMGRHLFQDGHRKVAYIMCRTRSRWSENRLKGLQEAFGVAGDPAAVQVILYDPPDLSIDHEENFRAVYSIAAARRVNKDHLNAFISAIRRMEDPLQVETNNAVAAVHVARAVREVKRDPGITAWVGENDAAAIACLETLTAARRKRCRVVGFDDTRRAFGRSLTSYNFGMDRLVRTMVAAIVDPAVVKRGEKGRPVEVEGAVIVR